ncbi:hypothetical protein SAMN05892877_117124 [Rhizobium subbaraonis]|uniref:Uncharacterized protein n=1 Tax=Rhizobium subbaraonis TaxID=908946 RepID=A0A285UUZ5_9HYPH|nr:hypothetical protein [Rhizobium subbaraonis]SOC45735.1 hypothetical protein SAMN05892877_117124 [Rhizobium subbaraonis]
MDTMTFVFAGISFAVVTAVFLAGSVAREVRNENSVDLDERMFDIELTVFGLTSSRVPA